MQKLKLFTTTFFSLLVCIVGLFFSQIILNFKIIDYYLLIVLFIADLGLLITSLSAIKELKKEGK